MHGDACPPPWRRSHRDLAANDANALAHAEEAETVAAVVPRVESLASIRDMEMERLVTLDQADRRVARPAVLDDVVQRFLDDAEDANSDVLRRVVAVHGVAEVDVDAVLA